MEDVATRLFDVRGTARISALVCGQWHRTEPRQRFAAGIPRIQAAFDVLARFALDMKRQFFVEFLFDASR